MRRVSMVAKRTCEEGCLAPNIQCVGDCFKWSACRDWVSWHNQLGESTRGGGEHMLELIYPGGDLKFKGGQLYNDTAATLVVETEERGDETFITIRRIHGYKRIKV